MSLEGQDYLGICQNPAFVEIRRRYLLGHKGTRLECYNNGIVAVVWEYKVFVVDARHVERASEIYLLSYSRCHISTIDLGGTLLVTSI